MFSDMDADNLIMAMASCSIAPESIRVVASSSRLGRELNPACLSNRTDPSQCDE